MAKSSTSFKPGNTFWKYADVGAPEEWTPEKIKGIIADLNEWLKKEDEVSLTGFRGHYGLTYSTIKVLQDKSPAFARAYDNAKTIMASRLTRNKDVHSGAFNRYVRMYDAELNEHETEVIKEEKLAEAMAAKMASNPQSDQILESNQKMMEQLSELQAAIQRKIESTKAAKE
jgi:hypothetical protein